MQPASDYWIPISSAPDAMVIVDAIGTIIAANDLVEELFGYKKEELIGEKIEILIPERYKAIHPNKRDRFMKEHHARAMGADLKLTGRKKDGTELPVEISLSPVTRGGATTVVAAIRDITERREKEEKLSTYMHELEQSNANLDQFAYVASHDLQEPIRTITNFVGLLELNLRDKLGDTDREYMNFITSATWRMKQLISDLLTYSRIGRNQDKEWVDCNKVIDEILSDLQLSIQETSAIVTVERLPMILGSKTEIKLIFQNLIDNAIKFRKKDVPPDILIRAEDVGEHWHICVQDNGIGIDEIYSHKVFILFQRLHPATEYPGTGIGMATTKKIVDKLGGQIWIKSAPGVGATFHIKVPKTLAELQEMNKS